MQCAPSILFTWLEFECYRQSWGEFLGPDLNTITQLLLMVFQITCKIYEFNLDTCSDIRTNNWTNNWFDIQLQFHYVWFWHPGPICPAWQVLPQINVLIFRLVYLILVLLLGFLQTQKSCGILTGARILWDFCIGKNPVWFLHWQQWLDSRWLHWVAVLPA